MGNEILWVQAFELPDRCWDGKRAEFPCKAADCLKFVSFALKSIFQIVGNAGTFALSNFKTSSDAISKTLPARSKGNLFLGFLPRRRCLFFAKNGQCETDFKFQRHGQRDQQRLFAGANLHARQARSGHHFQHERQKSVEF